MLLKFLSTDVQNTAVVDCRSGEVLFTISTTIPGTRSRSTSAASFYSFASSSSSSRELLTPGPKSTTIVDAQGAFLADITWLDATASSIHIGDEELPGAAGIFDVNYVKVLPEETLIPTRLEYVWRTTPESLTLLDDDYEVIGMLHQNCVMLEDDLSPASVSGAGHDYLELTNIRADEVVELLASFLLMCSLRERMYWITKYVYGQQASVPASTPAMPRSALGKLRRKASRSLAGWRQAVFGNKKL